MNFEVISGGRLPIKAWVRGVQLEDAAKQQLLNLSNMPFIHKHIAAMPDVHWGMGATVGSVIATKGAIIPAAVGGGHRMWNDGTKDHFNSFRPA